MGLIGDLGEVAYSIVAHDKTGTGLQSVGDNITKVGGVMTVASGAIAAGFLATSTRAADFETQMLEVFTLLPGISKTEMGNMTEDVMALGEEYGLMAEDVVPALYQAISAGVPKENVFDFLEIAAKSSIGGVTDLETAVDGLTSVTNAYGHEVISTEEASDILFTTVRLGKTNFSELSAYLFNVVPVASSLGVSFEEVGAAMAAMTAQGVPTAQSSTQLRQLLVELSKANSKTAKTFEAIAGESFPAFISSGGTLNDALKLMNDHAKATGGRVNDLFGSVEAGNAALLLTSENGSKIFIQDLMEMEKAAGATDQAFGTMSEGGKFALEQMRSEMNNMILVIGTELIPILRDDIVPMLKDDLLPILKEGVIPALKLLLDVFHMLPDPAQKVAVGAGMIFLALGPILMVVGQLLPLIGSLTSSLGGLGGIAGTVGGALKGLLAGMSTDIAAGGMAAGGSLAAAIGAGAVLGLAGVWILVKSGVMQGISDIGRSIESSPLGSMIMDALKIVLAPIGSLGAGIIALVQGDFARIPEVMIAPFEQAGEAIGRNIDRIRDAFSGIGTVVTGGVQALGGAVQGMISSFAGMGAIGGYASAAFGNIGGAFNAMAGQVRGVFSQMFSSILGLIQSTAGGFYNAGMNIITSIVNGIVAAAGGIVTAIASALNQVRALFPFSPAKEGPLAETPNWGTWMSAGMETAATEVAAAASTNLAAPVAAGVAGGVAAGGRAAGGGGGDTINIAAGAIVINGAGQNAEEIANQVIAKLGQAMAGKRQQMGYRTTT